MTKKILSVVSVLTFLLFSAIATAQNESISLTTELDINSFVDISLETCPNNPTYFFFGSLDPGTINTSIVCQDGSNSALAITIEATTNIPVNVDISATDFIGSGAEIIPINMSFWGNTSSLTSAYGFPSNATTSDAFGNDIGGTGSVVIKDLWFWVSTPNSFLPGGTYTTILTIFAYD